MFDADKTLGSNRWALVRLSVGGETEVVLLSSRFFSLTTHFARVTIPCSCEDCDLCGLLPSRGLFYVAAVCGGSVRIVELGGLSASLFEQHCKLLHGGVQPGLQVLLSRKSAKAPVRSEVIGWKDGVCAVEPLDLATHVMALYKFPPANPSDSMETYEVRCRQIAAVRNRRLAMQLMEGQRTGVQGR